jgi:transposase
MSDAPRMVRPDRRQKCWDAVDLDSQLPDDHMARIAWDYVEGLDVSPLEAKIKARGSEPGRPATDPRLHLALWLYATLDGVGSARELEKLCGEHTAYRWLCGGVSVNYHSLADFRVDAGAFLDQLLSTSIAALARQGLVSFDCLAVDGVRVRASAGSSSFRRMPTLKELQEEAERKVRALRDEVDEDPLGAAKRRQAAKQRAAAGRAASIAAAIEANNKVQAEREKDAETTRSKEPKRKEPRTSTTDPDARVMKMADGGFRPAYNVQVRSDLQSGLVISIDVTNCASDRGQLTPAVEDIERRYDKTPSRTLADGGFDGRADIEKLYGKKVEVFCPLPKSKGKPGDPKPKRGDGPGVKAWRLRMSTDEGIKIYRQRFPTERPHADMRNRGLYRYLVRGIEKVKAVTLWHITAFNLLQTRLLARRSQARAACA